MLKQIELLGNIGSSRQVGIYADGDGDCHFKFNFDNNLPLVNELNKYLDDEGNLLLDAG